MERLWYGSSLLAWLLVPFSWIYRIVIALRRLAYRSGLLRSYKVPVPVVVIGNVTVGGTGKTPLVVWLVAYLQALGMRPGIVSRGYGGSGAGQPLLVSDDSSPQIVGDEPLLLARRTGVPVCVSADRVAAANHLVTVTDINIIVTDDGLQHYRLQRDAEFVVIDAERGLGNGHLLPAGPLREPAKRLGQANMVFVNGKDRRFSDHVFTLAPGDAQQLNGADTAKLDAFKGISVWAVAGIGNPDRFYQLLRLKGIEVQAVPVADHGIVDLEALRNQQNWPILMTEKDAVKYPQAAIADAWWVPVKLEMAAESQSAVEHQLQGLLSR